MQKVIVIGASSGLGKEVAKLLIADGYTLGLAARRTQPLEDLKALAPERVMIHAIDVTSDDAPQALEHLIDMVGDIDLFVYTAGVGFQNMELEPDIELKTVNTNALGFTRMIGAAYRYMAEHGGGHIAAISSIAGTKGLGAAPSYSATKAMQNTYLQALEQQAHMRNLNITFTDLRPGFVATPLLGDNPQYPMLLKTERVAKEIVTAIKHHRHVWVIDWRWRIATALWRRIPRCLWRHLKVK
ncbi:MAG: SDR family NAD(P)-dependent oxidoreductase [Muribaculaceae bacterium]|nr:SDR family NAD(P)-dependent oxidoreductase [Muribaculaceae bacterium]